MNEPSSADRPKLTLAEMQREVRQLQKQERLRRLARGIGKPRTMRETEIWREGLDKRFKSHRPGKDDEQAADDDAPA